MSTNAINTPPPTRIGEVALSIAISQLGQQEQPKGSNSGPMVDQYLASVGLKPGYAWCQAFVHWCYQEAAKVAKVPSLVPRTGGVAACWKTTKGRKISLAQAKDDPSLIKPGYQFVLLFHGGVGHTGIVERVEGNVIHTIEGNSNDDGSREGYEVVRHTRVIGGLALVGFIEY